MDSYSVVMDVSMLKNAAQTNISESLELLNIKLILYFIFLGVLPAYAVYKVKLVENSYK